MKDNQQNQLFTELTAEEGANVSGGRLLFPFPLRRYYYTIDNKSGKEVNFKFGGHDKTLEVGKTQTYVSYKPSVVVKYDEIIGPGYEIEHTTLKAGKKAAFDRNGVMLLLTGGGQDNPIGANVANSIL